MKSLSALTHVIPAVITLLAFSPSCAASTMNISSMKADSKAGMSLLSKSRVLEEQQQQAEEGDDQNQAYYYNNDMTWMQGYSIKFLGCHHVAHWNSDADENDEVKIKTERQVRFRLCPSSSCNSNSAIGCNSNFGDYVVDMATFLDSYLGNQAEIVEEQCENRLKQCNCGDDKCEYSCYKKAGLEDQCMDYNPYYDDDDGNNAYNQIDLQEYTYCTQVNADADNNDDGDNEENQEEAEGEQQEGENRKTRRRRKLDQQEVAYFLGPYCTDKGIEIHLGLFTDDTCTEFADSNGGRTAYLENYGTSIPYYGTSLVDNTCYTCKDTDYDSGDVFTRDVCETTYTAAGKCESRISSSTSITYPNENACSYIQGIKLLKHTKNGVIYRNAGSLKAAIAIAFFATMFVVFGFYVWYLRKLIAAKEALRIKNSSSPRKKKGFFRTLRKKLSFNKEKKKNALI